MVLALYVVAGVMVAGGLLAIYSGSDIIVMERGWTMVISGSVMAASGALLVLLGAIGLIASRRGLAAGHPRPPQRRDGSTPDRSRLPGADLAHVAPAPARASGDPAPGSGDP